MNDPLLEIEVNNLYKNITEVYNMQNKLANVLKEQTRFNLLVLETIQIIQKLLKEK